MAVKPNARSLEIREQIIEDPVSGLTFQFAVAPVEDAPFRLRVYGDLPNGNREFLFDSTGQEVGAGTSMNSPCRPSWLSEVPSQSGHYTLEAAQTRDESAEEVPSLDQPGLSAFPADTKLHD